MKAAKKKKAAPKMDRKLVSKQGPKGAQYEIKYLAGKLRVSQAKIREARKAVGRSRKAITEYIKNA